MSIYNTNQGNQLDIRARESTFDSLLVWNPRTERYEHVTPGGGDGEPVTLPYYLENDSIQFTNARGINGGFVQDVDTILDSVLPAHEASLQQLDERLVNVENTILPAHEASLEELDGRVLGNTNNLTELGVRTNAIEIMNAAQDNSINAIAAKTVNINQTASTALTMGYTTTSTIRMQMNSTGLNVYSGLPAANPSTLARVTIKPTSIDFNTATGGLVYLDTDRVDNLGKYPSVFTADYNNKVNFIKGVTFPGAVETLDTSNKKMIVMDSTTKALSYAAIPSGGGDSGSSQSAYYKIALDRDFREIVWNTMGYWAFANQYGLSSSFAFTHELLLDFADMPMITNNTYDQTNKYFALFMDTITAADSVSVEYFPHEDDNMTGIGFRAFITAIPFNSLPKTFIRVHLMQSQLGVERSFKGKLCLSIKRISTSSDGTPTGTIGPTG